MSTANHGGRGWLAEPAIKAALITALATIIVALIGAFFVGRKTQVFEGLAAPPTVSVTQTVTPAPKTYTTTASAPEASTVTVTVTVTPTDDTDNCTSDWHCSNDLGLADRTSADLDAPKADRQWGMANLPVGKQYDIKWVAGDGLFIEGGAQFSLDVQPPLSRAVCTTAQKVQSGDELIPAESLGVGTGLCVISDEGRYAALTVITQPSNGSSIDLKVVVYNK